MITFSAMILLGLSILRDHAQSSGGGGGGGSALQADLSSNTSEWLLFL